ncbi:MAG TPA: archease [Candidatus Binataceae bacterium]|nr:archease [Candidatus Binataceae bacterium]
MSKDLERDLPLYRELDHTADLGIEVIAATRCALFRRAALALAALLVDQSNVIGAVTRESEIGGHDDIELMHDLLTELLQLFAADGFIWRDADIDERGSILHVRLQGESFDPNRHTARGEIKAVTYHQMTVEHTGTEWRARIIFDV